MDLKNIFKKKEAESENTYSEFDSQNVNSNDNANPFNSKELDNLHVTKEQNTESAIIEAKKRSPFSNLLKKIKNDNENVLHTVDSSSDESYHNFKSGTTQSLDKDDDMESKYDFTRKSIDKETIVLSADNGYDRRSISSDLLSEGGNSYKEKTIPLIGKLPVKKQYQFASAIALLSFIGLTVGLIEYNTSSTRQSKKIEEIVSFTGNIQKFDNNFSNATLGKTGAYQKTQEVFELFDNKSKVFNTIKNEFSGTNGETADKLAQNIDTDLEVVRKNMTKLKSSSAFIENTTNTIVSISEDIRKINGFLDRLGFVYIQLGANQSEISNIYNLKQSLQNININLDKLLLSEVIEKDTTISLSRSIIDFKKGLEEVYNGNVEKGISPVPSGIAMNSYKKLAQNWLKFTDKINSIDSKIPDLIAVRVLSMDNAKLLTTMESDITAIINIMSNDVYTDVLHGKMFIISSLLLLAFAVFLLLYIYSVEKDNLGLIDKLENNKNNASIVKLLREMMPLQDGNLTKKTTVTDEITGVLADSINATIDSLSSLVKKIKDTSITMRQKTNEVNVISLEMLKSNEEQANAIGETGQSVIQISKSIEEISSKTNDGAQVAENSVKVSEQGAKQVMASLDSMRKINENMNETGHLMKKVTDSSKQISEIVELLSDIAENTSILALNATVQAAKAGEAGKGFKIVADSIQELADNAGEATRRVGALIAAVQTDIQAAEDAVKKTTEEASNGAGLSELANESLNQMTEVSNNLALIVRTISEDAKKNALVSKQISSKMKGILDKTEENKASTQKTASSITEIAEISNELGESVQTFIIE